MNEINENKTFFQFFVLDYELTSALENIAKGSVTDGDTVLAHFVHAMDSGITPDPRALKFVIDSFKEILLAHYAGKAGKEIDFAKIFRIKAKRRPRLSIIGRSSSALQYGKEISDLMNSGSSNYDAISCVAEKYKLSPKTIQRYYSLFNKIIDD